MERHFAEFLAQRGFAALIVRRKQLRLLPDEGFEQIEEYLRTSVIRLRLALDWAQTRKEIDPERIGTLGLSLGGVLNAVLAGLDNRPKAHVIALAGGNLADVICYTHDRQIKRYRQQFMKRNHLTLEELRWHLRQVIKTDPMYFAHYVGPKNVLFFIAWFDRIIGRKYSRKLAKALGNPERYYFPLGHHSSVLMLPFVRVGAFRFFEERLKKVPQGETARPAFWRQEVPPRRRPPTLPDRQPKPAEVSQGKPSLSQSTKLPPR